MTTRRDTLIALASGMAFLPFHARAQPAATVPQLGYLHPASADASDSFKLLMLGLRDLGYVDRKNIVVAARSAHGKPDELSALAAELVRLNVDVLVAVGPAAVQAAISVTRSIPIVAVDLETEPVRSGWVASMARPGGNVTGFFLDLSVMAAKWLQLLREAVPGAREVALLWDSTTGRSQIEAVTAVANRLAIGVHVLPITTWDKFDAALSDSIKGGAQAIVMLSSPTVFQYSARIAEFTKQHHLPAISPFRPFAEAGGLMAYGPDLQLYFRRPATTIDKILKGAKPGDLPIEQPTNFELVINLKTAKALGLTIPQSLLLRADEVIQ